MKPIKQQRNVSLVEVLVTLIEAYEAKHHPIPAPDPIAAIEFMMAQKGLSRRDLEPAIGSRGRETGAPSVGSAAARTLSSPRTRAWRTGCASPEPWPQ